MAALAGAMLTTSLAVADASPASAAAPIDDAPISSEAIPESTPLLPSASPAVEPVPTTAAAVADESAPVDVGIAGAGTQSDIVSIQPARVLETRPGQATEDGRAQFGRRLTAGSTTEIPIAGRVGIDQDAEAAIIYVTAVRPSGPGFVTLFPCGERPLASSLNHAASAPGNPVVIGNEVIAKLSDGGSVCVFTRAETDLTFDVVGFVPASSSYTPIDPVRMLETRIGQDTFDGQSQATGRVGPDDFIEVTIAGRGAVPADAAAAVVYVTAVRPDGPGFVTMYPCGTRPNASSLNYTPGAVIGNEVIVKLTDAGSVCAYSRAEADLTFDVVGYIPASGYVSLDPARVLETRVGQQTIDGQASPGARLAAGSTTEVQIAGRAGVPADATAAAINVTAVRPQAAGFFTVYPCGERPLASSLNYFPGNVRANEIVTKLSDDGTVCIFTLAETDALFDVVGAVTPPQEPTPPSPPSPPSPPTPPSPVDTGRAAGWHVVPENLLFTEPGEQHTVEVILVGDDGTVVDQNPPADTKLVGRTGAFAVSGLDGNRFTLTAGPDVGAELLAVQIPDVPSIPVTATSARLQPNVRPVTDDEVVFPPTVDGADFDTAPFTRAEVEARVGDIDGAPSVIGIRRPVVLAGEPIPTGTLLVNDGDNDVLGRVVEPPGLPTLVRGGRSLITVELVALEEIYAELAMDFGEDDLLELGLVTVPTGTYTCDEATPAEDCPSVQDFFDTPQALGVRSTDANGFRSSLQTGDDGRIECTVPPGGVSVVSQAKVLKLTPGINSYGFLNVDGSNGRFTAITEFGVRGTLSATFSVTLALGASASFTCTLFEAPTVDVPTGPLDPYLTIAFKPTLEFGGGVTATAGPRVVLTKECRAQVKIAAGFEYKNGQVVKRDIDNVTSSCKPTKLERTDGVSGDAGLGGVAANVSLTLGFNAVLAAGGRIGGSATKLLGQYLGEPDLGFFDLIKISTGPRVKALWENRASMLDKGSASSRSDLVWGTTVTLGLSSLQKLVRAWLNSPSITLSVDFDILDIPIPNEELSKLTKALEPESMRAMVDGEESTGTSSLDVRVKAEDALELGIDLKTDSVFFPDLEAASVYQKNSGGEWEPAPNFQPEWTIGGTSAKPTLNATHTVSADLCEQVGSDGAEFAVVLQTTMYVVLPTPGWGGTIKLACDKDLQFEPATVPLSKADPTKTVELVQEGLDGETFQLVEQVNAGNGSIVTLDPVTTTFEANDVLGVEDGARIEIEVSLECGSADETIGEHKWLADVPNRSGEGPAILTIQANCSDDFVDITQDVITVPNDGSAGFSLTSQGTQDDEWVGVGTPNGPENRGTLRGSESTSDIVDVLSGTIEGRKIPILPAQCGGTPGEGSLPRVEATRQLTTTTRGGDSVRVIFPEHIGFPPKDGSNCPPPDPPTPPPCVGCGGAGGSGGSGTSSGGGWGDPHLISFDGATYDAQTLGEYVYAEPAPGGSGPRVIARHEFTAPSPLAATSITAVAVELGGRVIELYGRPVALRVDGVPTTLPLGSSLDLGNDLLLTRSGDRTYRVDHPELSLVAELGAHINVEVTVAADGSYVGHLGVADGDPGNDLVVRDPSQAVVDWTTYLIDDVREHGDELYEIAASWRLTDPDDSPFSIPTDVFATPNPGRPGTETLAPFRAIAEEQLGLLASLCDADTSAGSYAVDVYAIELALGLDPLPATCTYIVAGTVVTDAPSAPVGGATVVVDGPGLAECTTTTTVIGNYRCELSVDLAELGGAAASFPLTVDVEVTAPDGTLPVGSGSGSFTARPNFDGRAVLVLDDITVPVDSVSLVRLTGATTQNGVPITSASRFSITSTGTPGTSFDIRVAPDGAGAFESLFVVPPSSPSTSVSFVVGLPGDQLPTVTFDDLTTGVNDRTFDAAYNPVELTVTGDALVNGLPAPSTPLIAHSTRANGSQLTLTGRIEPDGAGAYRWDFTLPLGTENVELSATVGHPDEPAAMLLHDVPDSGPDAVEFDVVVTAPRLDLTGTLRRNGVVPAGVPLSIEWRSATDDGVVNAIVAPDPVDGSFATSIVLPSVATSATVIAAIGLVPADHVTAEATGLVDGANPLDLDGDVVTPVLDVTGTVIGGSVGADDPFDLRVVAPSGFETADQVEPNPDGTYAATIELPGGTTSATLTAQVGASSADWASVAPVGLVDGPNPVTLDAVFDAVAVVATGTLTKDGVPIVGPVTMRFIGRDGGVEVAVEDVPVVADGSGAYAASVVFPTGVDEVAAFALVGPFFALRVPIVRTGLSDGRNDVTIDDDVTTTTLEITGDFPSPPRWFAGIFSLAADVEVTRPDGTQETLRFTRPVVASVDDGSYSVSIIVPEASTAVDLTADLGSAVDPSPMLLDEPVVPGANPITFSETVDIGVGVDVSGLLFDADGPFQGDASIRYVTRDLGGTVIDDETVDVTTSALGEFALEIDTLNSARSIAIVWLVGVDGEAPAFTTFSGLVPGSNQVDYTDVYDPPIVELTGVVTRNGVPVADDLTIDVDVTGGTETNIDVTVTPDASGAYSLTRTLQRAATEVDATVATNDPDDGVAQLIDRAVVGGSNPVELDLTIERTNLQVSGTMSLAGTVPVGPVDVNLTISGDGVPDRTTTLSVDPDDATGAYSFELLLPQWATSVEAEFEIGIESDNWPVTVFDTLLVGDDPRVYDAIADVRLLDIDGTFTMGLAPYTREWRLGLRFERADGSFISTDNITIPASPDGSFVIDYEPPSNAATVRLSAYLYFNINIASDQLDVAITDGVNDIDFDPFEDEIGIVASGQLLEEGAFDTDGRPLTVRYYSDQSSNFVERSWSTGDSDDEGRYEARILTLPSDTVRIEIGSNNTGSLENDEIFQSYDVVNGLNELVFDENYIPLRVTISGNLRRDGDPVTEQTLIEWNWRQLFEPSGVFTQRRSESVTPDANGDFSLTVIGPRNADEIGPTTAWLGINFDDHPSAPIQPVTVGADNQVTLNADYDTTSVTISGEIEYNGQVPASRNIDIYMFDADGNSLSERNALAVPSDPVTGAYLIEDVELASATAEIRMEFLFGGFNSQSFERSSVTVPITPGSTDNTASFSFKTTSIELTGNLSAGGSPVANDFRNIAFVASDGVQQLGTLNNFSISTDSNGDYSTTAYLPAGTTEVEISVDLDGSAPVTITGLETPGVTTGTADFVGTGGDGLTITGTVLDNGSPLPNITPTFSVTIYDDGDIGDGPFDLTDELNESDLDPDSFVDGDYSLFINSSGVSEVDFVQVDIDIGYTYTGGQSIYTKVFDLRSQTAPYTLEFDVDASARQIIYATESYIVDQDAGDVCLYSDFPFVHNLTMFAYDGDSGDAGSTQIGTFTSVMIPDPSGSGNDSIPVVWSPPVGTVDVAYEIDTTPFYDPAVADAFFGFSFGLGTYDYSGVVDILSYDEADCDPSFGGGI